MQISVLKSKINKARVTNCQESNDDSCEIDGILLDTVNISTFEKIHINNITKGWSIITHAIRGKDNSGVISINSSPKNNFSVGDLLTISSYAYFDKASLINHTPKVCQVNEVNILVKSI